MFPPLFQNIFELEMSRLVVTHSSKLNSDSIHLKFGVVFHDTKGLGEYKTKLAHLKRVELE